MFWSIVGSVMGAVEGMVVGVEVVGLVLGDASFWLFLLPQAAMETHRRSSKNAMLIFFIGTS